MTLGPIMKVLDKKRTGIMQAKIPNTMTVTTEKPVLNKTWVMDKVRRRR